MVLQLIPVVQKPVEVVYQLQFDYTLMNEVMMIIKPYGCSILAQETQLFCLIRIGIPKARLEEVLYKLNEIRSVEVQQIK